MIHQESSKLNTYRVATAAARDGKVAEALSVTGRVMMTLYRGPDNSSSFEIVTAYRQLLQSKGFEVVFACDRGACGEKFPGAFYELAPFASDPGWNNSAPIVHGNPDASYVLVARSNKEPLTYVSLIVSQGWWRYPVYKLDVVEVQEQAGRISSVAGPAGQAGRPGAPAGGVRTARGVRYGVQMASDALFGLLLKADRYEVCVKVQAVLYDGFPGGATPDNNMLMAGAHAAYLFRPTDEIDIGIGMDCRQGVTLSGDIEYRQYMDVGPRVVLNYHIGSRLMVSGILYPVWVVVRETDVDDSYQLTATLPSAAVAVALLF